MKRRRFVIALAVAAAIACVITAGALAYSVNYVTNATWAPGSQASSGFTTGFLANIVSFDNRYGGTPYMGTSYVDTGGGTYMTWHWENDGYIFDDRNEFNYAAAACRASGDNNYNVYISYCYTSN